MHAATLFRSPHAIVHSDFHTASCVGTRRCTAAAL